MHSFIILINSGETTEFPLKTAGNLNQLLKTSSVIHKIMEYSTELILVYLTFD